MQRSFNLLLLIIMSHCILLIPADAQAITEQQAAKETYIDGLRLLPDSIQGIYLSYVEEDTNPGGGKYFCGALSMDDSDSAINAITLVLSELPYNVIEKLNLKYVLLCSNAKAKGQRIGGIPVPPLNLLMLDVGEGRGSDEYLQHQFLHELYHFIEFRFNTYRDARWNKLYGKGYANNYNGLLKNSPIGSGKQGFLNVYAMTFPHEERAELFSFLILKPTELNDYIDLKDDKLLKEKAVYLIKKCEEMLGLNIAPSGMPY